MAIDMKSVVSFDAPVKEVALASKADVLQAPDLVKARDHYRISTPKTPWEENDVARMMLFQKFDCM
jgi:hypothetical protein